MNEIEAQRETRTEIRRETGRVCERDRVVIGDERERYKKEKKKNTIGLIFKHALPFGELTVALNAAQYNVGGRTVVHAVLTILIASTPYSAVFF